MLAPVAFFRIYPASQGSAWNDYYDSETGEDYLLDKQRIVEDYLQRIDARTAWDLGCNRGLFSKIMARRGIKTIAFDNDHECVDRNYTELKKNGSTSPYLPLVLDLSTPARQSAGKQGTALAPGTRPGGLGPRPRPDTSPGYNAKYPVLPYC